MTRIAIMQPTYLPWCGYFALMEYVDIFVILDQVQFAKRSWQQRNQIKTKDGVQWLTVPVLTKGKRDQLISDVSIDKTVNFSKRHIASISHNYSKTKYYKEYSKDIYECIENENSSLLELNLSLITKIREQLGINSKIIISSDLGCNGSKDALLASICKKLGASQYISPEGSREYMDKSQEFNEAGIPFDYFNFTHPKYSQLTDPFIPYMSIIDLLFNCGPDSIRLLKS